MIFTFLFMLFFSNQSFAGERHLLLLGGGGDPEQVLDGGGNLVQAPSTIFDRGLSAMGSYLKANPWQSEIRFDGGHSQTEEILSGQFPNSKSKGPFTVDSYRKMIENYEERILSGDIRPGEQLMVIIDSHGAELADGENTHQISVGRSTRSLDSLQSLADLAKLKGIKLAIMDMTCHSGSTLKLANDNTCVVTASGPNHYGSNTFFESFVANMKPGKSIEDVFLKTRESLDSPSFPMISTPTGLKLNQSLYQAITPFLYYTNDGGKLSYYLQSEGISCLERIEPATVLINQIEQLQATLNDGRLNTSNLAQLVRSYSDQQEKIIATVKSWNLQNLKKIETFKCQIEAGQFDYTWKEILLVVSSSEGRLNWLNKEAKIATTAKDRTAVQEQINCLQKVIVKGKEIQTLHPELLTYVAKYTELIKGLGHTYDLAFRIADAENKFYYASYESLAKKDETPNACKDFKL